MKVPYRQLWLTSVSASVLGLAFASHALSDEINIDGPETATQAIDGDDTLTITEDGSITTSADDEYGVESTGDDNIITNDGTILTSGNSAHGIFSTGANARITNNGLIETTGGLFPNGIQNSGDFAVIINNGTILTVYDGIGNDGANATISNTGVILATGSASDGIDSSGTDVSITNIGLIEASADGIESGGENTSITNTGLIQGGDDGIDSSGNYADIVNSGTILATNNGIESDGTRALITNTGLIQGGDDGIESTGIYAVIVNSGTILADTDGIKSAGENTSITNTGLIQGGDDGIDSSGNDAVIVNIGTILATDMGIVNDGSADAVINNSGTIEADGTGIYNINSTDAVITNSGAILAGQNGVFNRTDDAVITNSGSIISERSSAIFVSSFSTGTTVNLHPPSFLGGAITFYSSTTLNITTGASHSVLWQLPTANVAGGAANVSGPVPWFYDTTTGEFATYDPTGLTASFNQLADTSNTLARLGRYGLRQARRGGAADAASAALAYGEDGTQSAEGFDKLLATNSGRDPAYGPASGRFWLTGYGGYANYDGDEATLDQRVDQIGAALGYAWAQSPDMRLGFMAGYINGSITAESKWADSQDITSNGVFAGVHGDKRFGRLTLGLGLAGGWQTNDSDRFVNDNTATTGGLTLGESTASASYDSWFVTPEAALSADIALGQTGLTLTPSIRGRYALQQTGSYTETGSAANATVDSHTFGVLEGDFELAVSRSFGPATVSGRAGYLVRSSAGDDDVPVTLLGITNSIGLGETGRSAAYLGAALDLNLGPRASFTLDGQGYLSDDVDALEGMARLAIRF